MSFGFGFGFPKNYVAALFNTPASLFTTGVNGAWYDPSDFSTMFQDAAGTTPVTAVGQPVGLMLDKSKGLVLGDNVWSSLSGGSAAGTCSIVDGSRYSYTGIGTGVVGKNIGTISGRTYYVTFNISSPAATNRIYFTSSVTGALPATFFTFTSNVTYTIQIPAYGAFLNILASEPGTSGTAIINSLSVRELPGNHAFNPSGNSANFPVLSARYSLLTKTEQFDDAIWSKQNVTIAADAISAPNGTITADALIPSNATNTFSGIYRTEFTSPQKTFSAYVKKGSKRWAMLLAYNGNNNCWFDLDNKVPGTRGANFSSSNITDIGNGWLRISATLSAALGGNANIGLYCSDADNSTQCIGDGVTAGIYIWGADLRVTNDALNQPAYQRVNTATDYDTVGFKPYLSFNGVNQWLQTNSIDFTYGDKMFVSAGARKLSDGNYKALVELSTSPGSAGTFWMAAPGGLPPSTGYSFETSGTAASGAFANSGYPQPITNVISGIGNISAPSATLRVNGAQVAQSTATQGTGNYGNYPLYIGARAGTSLWFNGRLYGLVVSGKQASASEIAGTEAWLNQKTGAY